MAKRLQEYVKYTTKELDQYIQTEGSCVRKVNTNLHLSMGPFCLSDFKHVLSVHILRSKIGYYDIQLDGIVLDVKKIKVLGTSGAIRCDDPKIHVNINADVYVFKPEEGAVLTGVVKHIGQHHVGVILYRVFNANLRVAHKIDKSEIQMDQEVKFQIRKYNLQNVFPYIEGELLTPGIGKKSAKGKKSVPKTEDSGDSGIEEKDGVRELDDLLSIIKIEAPTEFEDALEESINNKPNSATDSLNTTNKKSTKKRKNNSISSTNHDDAEIISTPTSKNIEQELLSNDESITPTVKKIKKEKGSSATKKGKNKEIVQVDDEPLTPIFEKIRNQKETSSPKKSKRKVSLEKMDTEVDDETLTPVIKKIKKEKETSSTKKNKSKISLIEQNVKVKEEIDDDDYITSS